MSRPIDDFEKMFSEMRFALGVLICVIVFVLIAGWLQMPKFKDQLMFTAQLLSVLVAIFMVAVIGIQAKILAFQARFMEAQAATSSEQTRWISLQADIMNSQTEILRKQAEILELEKKPMLAFSKILEGMSVGRPLRSAKIVITNVAKYPILIEKVEFVSQVKYPDLVDLEKRILEKLEKTVLQPS